ncbi:MAG: hypothetical protein SNJ75_19410, partial [Gemmataceae bacterium]
VTCSLSRGLLLLPGLFAIGCGGNAPKLVPVEGVVRINGKPAESINIQFQPDVMQGSKGPTSFASTDKEGKFRLRTYDGKEGAVVGTHLVILVDELEDRPAQGTRAAKPPRVAGKYASPATTIRVEVKEGGGPITVDASSR